jgi:hypothetical protein
MAELKIPVRTESVYITHLDGTGTPQTFTPSALIKSSISFSATLKQATEEVVTQDGGTSGIYAVLTNGVTEGGTLSVKYLFKDPGEASESVFAFYNDWYVNDFSTNALDPVVPVTALNGTSNTVLLDTRLTFKDAGGAGVDQTWTAASYVKEISSIEPDGEKYAFTVTLGIVEAWTRA